MSEELKPDGAITPNGEAAINTETITDNVIINNDDTNATATETETAAVTATTTAIGNDNGADTNDRPLNNNQELDEATAAALEELQRPFCWLDPHPVFVILLVGKDETPFGIQRDFLAARSTYFMQHFKQNTAPESIEHLVRLPDTDPTVFCFAQNFLYTGQVFPSTDKLPSYEILISLWKLGHELGIDGLCDASLDAMTEYRRVTHHIPATPLLVQVWNETPEGSSIRKLLLSWAAEYMRSSDSRAEFARSLPQEVLSELVITMSSLDIPPTPQATPAPAPSAVTVSEAMAAVAAASQRQRVHYMEPADDNEGGNPRPAKKQRHSDVHANGSAVAAASTKTSNNNKKTGPRASLPASKPATKRKSNSGLGDPQLFSANQRLNFCADLLTRMLSGPGFWTRLVGPFKEPVDPVSDAVPDYLEKIKRPMDLGTMKAKMDRHEYADEHEFLADMNQIFTNCYTYWTDKHPMWAACERLQKTFEDKYSQMNKWISKMNGDEGN